MKIYNATSKIEQKLSELEEFMRKNNIVIEFSGYELNISVKLDDGNTQIGYIKDIDSKDNSRILPRFVESEKIVVKEY